MKKCDSCSVEEPRKWQWSVCMRTNRFRKNPGLRGPDCGNFVTENRDSTSCSRGPPHPRSRVTSTYRVPSILFPYATQMWRRHWEQLVHGRTKCSSRLTVLRSIASEFGDLTMWWTQRSRCLGGNVKNRKKKFFLVLIILLWESNKTKQNKNKF